MDLKIEKKVYKKKKIDSFYLSLGFLVFTILLTLGLYFYNMHLESKNKELETNINDKQNAIKQLQKDPKIVASSLYNSNLKTIKKIEDYSQVTDYINHLIFLRRKYNIDFKGFKYSAGELKTQALARSDSLGINYKKVVKFIKEYRENTDKTSLFDLGLVKSVVAKNNGEYDVFDIKLVLKNNISKILEESKKSLEEKRKKLEEKKQELLRKQREEFIRKQKEKSSSGTTNNSSAETINNL